MFTATALFLVVGIALLMEHIGLSPALGTFVAGVVLANSEYRHELEAEVEPLKGCCWRSSLSLWGPYRLCAADGNPWLTPWLADWY